MYILIKQSLLFAVPHKLSACSAGDTEAQVPLGIELDHIHSFGSEERRKGNIVLLGHRAVPRYEPFVLNA